MISTTHLTVSNYILCAFYCTYFVVSYEPPAGIYVQRVGKMVHTNNGKWWTKNCKGHKSYN